MTKDEIDFFRKSFDRLELILTQILEVSRKKSEKKPKQVSNAEPGAQKLANIWNEWKALKLPAIVGLSPSSQRHKNAAARWKEKPDVEYWIMTIGKINESAFCCGENDRGWLADFEFLVRPDTHFRVREGRYSNQVKKQQTKPVFNESDVKAMLLNPLPE